MHMHTMATLHIPHLPAKMDTAAVRKLKVTELRVELEARGLATKGLKAVLVARLTEAIEAGAAEEVVVEAETEEVVAETDADAEVHIPRIALSSPKHRKFTPPPPVTPPLPSNQH